MLKSTLNPSTRAAFRFLMRRNVLKECWTDSTYHAALVEFAAAKGERALQCLAGYFIYASDKEIVTGLSLNEQMAETFAHDLTMYRLRSVQPLSSEYGSYWDREYLRGMDKANVPGIHY